MCYGGRETTMITTFPKTEEFERQFQTKPGSIIPPHPEKQLIVPGPDFFSLFFILSPSLYGSIEVAATPINRLHQFISRGL
ncbi:hypothetical protein TNIN_410681 [Trichonephila inaurata madagascariensis]|uniref:Uncharacterized protein n=1 Tax=Trichonephila inaurata madagascariensis TaxID=2747483 RepID=A0A8X6YLA5_9ARAC|nr:hypothetical protein TNIN_410681 [Trichonephila inaurata madagascariensis]